MSDPNSIPPHRAPMRVCPPRGVRIIRWIFNLAVLAICVYVLFFT